MLEFETGTIPTLNALIQNIIYEQLLDTHTVSVGSLISYDETSNKATIQLDLKRKNADGKLIVVPPISQVPVIFIRSYGGNAYLKMPLLPGDTGVLLFNERSIDIWMDEGGVVDPQDSRKFDYSDAIFFPGLTPSSNPITENSANVVLQNKNKGSIDSSRVVLHPEGTLEFAGKVNLIPSVPTTLVPIPPPPPASPPGQYPLAQPVDVIQFLNILLDNLILMAPISEPTGSVTINLTQLKTVLAQVIP